MWDTRIIHTHLDIKITTVFHVDIAMQNGRALAFFAERVSNDHQLRTLLRMVNRHHRGGLSDWDSRDREALSAKDQANAGEVWIREGGMSYVPVADERIINFSPSQHLPDGWYVVQLDSGHYMATNGERDSVITVNRFHARKWAIQMAKDSSHD